MGKKIAFIGSSGGNLYKQGGNNLPAMMKEICGQTTAADMEIIFVQYVLASGSLDNVGPDSSATLYTWNGTEVQAVFQGTLTEVNVEAAKVDAELAKKIDDGEIDGVMFVSASPDGADRQAMEACARTKIPMAGTGGSGVALTQNMGCNVLSASGTTGTTNRTRAVAFTTALAKYWKIKYMPVIGNTGENAVSKAEGNIWKRINFRGIMMTSLPAFIAMALCLACSKIPGCGSLSDVFDTLINSIPIVICVIAAKQVSGLDEVGVVAGIVAGILAVDGGILGGLIIGILAGVLAYYISVFCFRHNVPGTTVNIASGGLGGLAAGLVGKFLIAPVALWIGNYPFMFSNKIVFAGALASATVGGAIVGLFNVKGTAYVPAVLAPFMANEGKGPAFAVAMIVAMGCVFAITMVANVLERKKSGKIPVKKV